MARSRVAIRIARDGGRWRRWRGWLTAALLAACVDGPTSPGRFGELRIRPSYADGDAPRALELSVDSAKVHVVRASEPSTALIDTTVRYESDTASMGWVLTLRSEEEPLLVDIAIWDGDTRVYSGEREVIVREAPIDEVGAEEVLVAYVGPAIVRAVTVIPESVTLDALNATASFTAEARDRNGEIVTTAFAWTSGNPEVATVDAGTGAVTAVRNGTTTIQAASGSVTGSASVVVAQRAATVTVTPVAPVFTALGASRNMQAAVADANGFAMAGASVTWSSSDDGVVSVDETGTVTAVAGGTATITASSGGVEGTTVVTVNPVADVVSITVSPANASLSAVGATAQFTAEARDAGGNALSGVQFVWTSSVENVATVDQGGLAAAASHGSTTIKATAGSVSGTATLVVDLTTTVAQIVVRPSSATLTAVGGTQQFTAEATDASKAIVPGVSFQWSSSSESVATVDEATGLATAIGHGSTRIIAAIGAVQGSASLAVNLEGTVASIVVTPVSATLTALDATQQFTAVARDGNGAVVPGVPFTWTSSEEKVATIGASSGLATATGNGTTTITASAGGVSGAATLAADLTATVTSVVVTPANATLTALGATQQFAAVARDANDAVVSGVTFVWSSSDASVALVDRETGLATAAGNGSATISAALGDVRGGATLSVQLSTSIASITVEPARVTLTTLGATQPFTAVARDANGAVLPGVAFAWASSAENVATIDPSGVATAAAHGSTTITATAGAVSGTATLAVDLTATVAQIIVSPTSTTLTTVGATQQFMAEARDAGGAVVPGVMFLWSSTNEGVATLDPLTGLATAVGHGAAEIRASTGNVQGGAVLTVDLTSSIASITIAPANITLTALGATRQFTATARDANGGVLPGVAFEWATSAPDVAKIDANSGLATVTGNGSTTITARANGVSGTAGLTADLAPSVASITVSPATATLAVSGATVQFSAAAFDAGGAAVPGIQFTWSSSAPEVATIDAATGLATGVANGGTTITARAGSAAGTASLVVHPQ